MKKVWVAHARYDHDVEERVVGLYTSRRKAKRAVLNYFDLDRGRWEAVKDGSSYEPLNDDWLHEQVGDHGSSGSVMLWRVH